MRKFSKISGLFLTALLVLSYVFPADAAESYGYQMALIDARANNPKSVLLNKKISPSSAAIREFEWVLETLRSRCHNSQDAIVTTLVGSWRIVERRGYDVTLLEFSRQLSDFANLAFQARRNQKMDFEKLVLKLLKDKYPQK
ncbi:MAG: hypothetical protein IT395_07600 [Candidatus Omnitrophica bacterium]|nr:hypothetical protein [Candidatus Omnitrophota bacterium]